MNVLRVTSEVREAAGDCRDNPRSRTVAALGAGISAPATAAAAVSVAVAIAVKSSALPPLPPLPRGPPPHTRCGLGARLIDLQSSSADFLAIQA